MKKITPQCSVLLILAFLSAQTWASSRLTVVEDVADLTLADTNLVLLGNRLLFQTAEAHGMTLWAQNTESNARVSLFEGAIANFQVPTEYSSEPKQLLRNEDLVFFLVGEQHGEKQIWRTDGTKTGTFKLDSSIVYQDLVSSQGLVFSHSVGGNIIATDGENVTEHQFRFPNTDNVCAFGLNDLITTDFDSSNSTTYIKRSKDGVLTDIPLPGGNAFFSLDTDEVWRLGDVCYFGLFRNNITSDVLMVSESGEVNYLSEQFNTSGMEQIFVFNNRIYARTYINDESRLVRLNQSLDGTDKVYGDSLGIYMYNAEVLNDYIVAQTTTPNISPAVRGTLYFDADLNEIPDLGGAFVPIPEYYPSGRGQIYLNNNYTNPSLIAEDVSFDSEFVILSVSNALVENVTSHEDEQDVFLMLKDKTTAKRSIVALTYVPGIGDSINGMWNDPEIKNQGLSIHTGERGDGSKYIFATVYTYQDGAPLWLAGVANIVHPQSSIEMLVGEYSNSNMFDPEATPTESVFGSLRLEMTACDQLKATLVSDTDSFVLNLSRIDNVHYSHLCLND